MATAKKKTANKKPAKKSTKKSANKVAAPKKAAAPAKSPTRASTKKAANTKPVVTKVPKKKAAKKAAKQPSLTRTVNMGPLRGDNSFPPGNKPAVHDLSRTVRTSPAKDSTRGPGGKASEGRGKDKPKP